MQGEVTGIDFDHDAVILADGRRLGYDSLVLAPGGVTTDFGVPGVAEHAYGLKSTADAVRLRHRVLSSFDAVASDLQNGRPHRRAATTIVIVGGGPTGVELAGGFAELTSRVLAPDYPEIDQSAVRIVLVEGQDGVLAGFADSLRANARETLEAMGVEVMLNTQVAEVTARSVDFADGDAIDADTVVWAAGIRAHPLAEELGLETGRGARAVSYTHLTLPTIYSV